MRGRPTREAVLDCLARIACPGSTASLAASGRLSEIVIQGGAITFAITIAEGEAGSFASVRAAAEQAVASLAGVEKATVVLTAPASGDAIGRRTGSPIAERVPSGPMPVPAPQGKPTVPRFPNLARVRHIVAVASGKGGVGKSTTACNLALALSRLSGPSGRLTVGILDADIYGPSMPKLLALRGQPRIRDGRTLEPLDGFGLKVMSIGFLVDAGKAMVWRGPMVASAVTQMLRDIAWGDLDVLVVDMPPGTGDAQLTLAQQAPLAGAVIVSTPQDLALIDARRGVAMFRDVGVPIIGLVENMSYFVCDGCGKRHAVFAHGGARLEAGRLDVPFLGEIPLDLAIRERSDSGLPIVVADPECSAAQAYRSIAVAVWSALKVPPSAH